MTPLLVIASTPAASADPSRVAQQNGSPASSQTGPVELLGAATETTRYWRYPDGHVTTEMWPTPVRVKKSGAWAWIDTTLTQQNGAVRPKVIKGDLSLPAGGGKGAKTTFSPAPNQSLTLAWPADLPTPKLEGSRATYVDAAGPGADLVVTALPTGFRYDVVLKSRPTKPLELEIPVKGQGLSVQKASDGRLRVTDAENRNVAVASHPTLLSKETARGRSAKMSSVDITVSAEEGQQSLLLKPDAAYLADPDTTYPVTIQSAFSVTPTADADVWSTSPDASVPYGGYLKAGTDRDGTSRAYLKFDISPLAGQSISNVTLSLLNIDGPSCGGSVGDGIQVRRVTSAWSPSTVTWNSQPTNTTENAVINKASVGGTCDPTPMNWDITAMAKQWADNVGNYGVVLMSPTETKSVNYRTYSSMDNTDGMDPPKITATFTPIPGPTVISPAGPEGVEVFTAPANWGGDRLRMAEAQAYALNAARDRVYTNSADLAPPYLDMVSGNIIVPPVSLNGRDLASTPLTGTAYLGDGFTDWTLPGEYSGDDAVEEGEGPAPVSEEYTFSPRTPDAAHSSLRLTEIANEVLELGSAQLPDADKLFSAGISAERNQVIVQATSVSPGLRSALAQRYGANAVAIWLQPGASRPRADDSRDKDDTKVNGGRLYSIIGGGICTAGFAWGSGSSQDWMLTAGHCVPQNSDGYTSIGLVTATNGSLDSTWVSGVGTRKLPGQPTYYGDVARISVDPGNHVASIFVGGPTSTVKRPVGGRWGRRAVEGDLYCVGGAISGQSCNWKVTYLGWKVEYEGGSIARWVQVGRRANRCNMGGDSGAPVYTFRSDGYVIAKGIHSGSTKNDDGTDRTSDCVSFFTDIHDVNLAFGDKITKAK